VTAYREGGAAAQPPSPHERRLRRIISGPSRLQNTCAFGDLGQR
jgi:hypothetical protein